MSSFMNRHPFDENFHLFEELLPYVLPSVPTCSNMLAIQNIRRAAIDLCQRSRIWRSTQHPLPTGNEMCEYEFEPPETAERVRVEWVTYEGRQLTPTTEHQLFKCDPEWVKQRGAPTHFLEMNTQAVRLWPVPAGWFSAADSSLFMAPAGDSLEADIAYDSQPCAVTIRISCKPSITASGMDGLVLDDHYSAIVNGALAYLFMTPGHPWSDPVIGQSYQAAFVGGIEQATNQAVDGNLSPIRTVVYGGL